jgi:hypothetical protein
MDRSQLLKRLDRAWEALKASYVGLSDAELMEPGVTGAWSVKDIIAHVTWWEEEALTHLPLILAGGRPARYSVRYGGIDAFNAQMAEQKRKLSLSEVLQQRDDTHRRLNDVVCGLIRTVITRSTPRGYGNGESGGQRDKGRPKWLQSVHRYLEHSPRHECQVVRLSHRSDLPRL